MPQLVLSRTNARQTSDAVHGIGLHLHNIRSVPFKQFEELPLFTLADPLLLQCIAGVSETGFPFVFRNAESGVRRLHVAADIDARTSCQRAHLVHQQLPRAIPGIGAASCEAGKLRILPHTGQHLVDDCGNNVISPEPLVQSQFDLIVFSHMSIPETSVRARRSARQDVRCLPK